MDELVKARLTVSDFRPHEDDVPEGWVNKSRDIMREQLGEEEFDAMEKRKFKDTSESNGLLGGISDKFKRTKLDLFSCHNLPMDSPEGASSGPLPVGGSGFLKIVSNPKFPDHGFFQKSRLFPVRMRHNNLSFEDDAMLDGRVACLKLTDSDQGGPLDLILHTGRVPQFYSADSFQEFVSAFRKGPESLKTWCHSSSTNYQGRVENVRRAPDSFHSLRYYSHVTYEFTSTDGTMWLARFKLSPADGSEETGLPNEQEQSNAWYVRRDESTDKPPDYLRGEYTKQLEASPVQYRLQVQVIRPDGSGHSNDMNNGNGLITESASDIIGNVSGTTIDMYDASTPRSSTNDITHNNNDINRSKDDVISIVDRPDSSPLRASGLMPVMGGSMSNNIGIQYSKDSDPEATYGSTSAGIGGSGLNDSIQESLDHQQSSPADLSNPCVAWDTKIAPWIDFAIITVSTKVPADVLAKTKFNLDNHILTCSPLEAKSARDFSSLGLALREFHGIHGQCKEVVTQQTTYQIVVITGKLYNAGTDADVNIMITGTRGRTPPINLDQKFRDDFEVGQMDEFMEEGPCVGEPVVIEMTLSSMLRSRRWYLEEVTVIDVTTRIPVRFPCYQWLTSQKPRVVLCRCQAMPPQLELLPYSYLQRKYEISVRQDTYQWYKQEGMPGRININRYEDLPKAAQFHTEHELDLFAKYLRTLANTGTGTLSTLLNTWNIVTDNPKLLTNFLKDKSITQKVIQKWDTDEEFGRQILNGPHPVRIKRINSLPLSLEIAREQIQHLMDRSISVDQEIEEGHVYMLSYPELDNLKWSTDYKGKYERHITSPICLLYVNKDDKCVPLAINLELGGPVWTPRDAPLDWKLAKMWVREADVQVHQVVSRHLHTQLVTEAVAIATLRNLPTAHPVYKILYPHVKYTIAVNVMGRQFLYPAEDGLFQKYLAVGGQHGDLIQTAYRSFNINDLHLPSNLAARGVADVNLLPGYWYRDDGLAVWTAMEKYIRTVLYMHYWNDDNVKADGELQAWIQDIGHNGLTEWDYIDGDDPDQHGIPSALTSLDELLHYLTIFVFTASAQHAALSSGMMDYYSYVPNAPTMMMTSPPAIKGMVTSTYLKKALPSRGKTAEIIAACYTLSRHGKHEVYLNTFKEQYFDDMATHAAQAAFIVDLNRAADVINKRNEQLDIPYTYLLPGRIPKTVSV